MFWNTKTDTKKPIPPLMALRRANQYHMAERWLDLCLDRWLHQLIGKYPISSVPKFLMETDSNRRDLNLGNHVPRWPFRHPDHELETKV